MPLTDEEREKLKKLNQDELIDLYGATRDKAEENEKKARAERGEIIKAMLSSKPLPASADKEYDPLKSKAFDRLTKILR